MYIDSSNSMGAFHDGIMDWADEQKKKLEEARKKLDEYKEEYDKQRKTVEDIKDQYEKTKDIFTGDDEKVPEKTAQDSKSVTRNTGITTGMLAGGAIAAAVVTYLIVRR